MLTKTPAVVLHSLRYGDSRMIVDMFTREQGRLSVVIAIPKTGRGRLKKQYFQPLTVVNAEVDVRQQAQLQKLRDCELLQPWATLHTDPSKLSIVLFAAEFLYHALKSEQRNTPLFDYITSSLAWLDGREERFANFHLVFLMRMSRFLGFFPNLDGWQPGCVFDLRESRFAASVPLHRDFLLPPEAARIRLLMRMKYNTMHLFSMSRTERGRALDVILAYYRIHLPSFPELRSLPVLKELWG